MIRNFYAVACVVAFLLLLFFYPGIKVQGEVVVQGLQRHLVIKQNRVVSVLWCVCGLWRQGEHGFQCSADVRRYKRFLSSFLLPFQSLHFIYTQQPNPLIF